MQLLVLRIFYKGRLFKVCPFTDDQVSVGSGEGLSLRLDNIAPWHILIEKKWDRYTIFDLGSETGTFVNGQRIAGEHALESGTGFQIGPYQIQFFIGPPPQNFPPPSTVSNEASQPSLSSPAQGPPSVPKEGTAVIGTETQIKKPPAPPAPPVPPAPVSSPVQGPPPVSSPVQGPPPVSSPVQGLPPVSSPVQGPPPVSVEEPAAVTGTQTQIEEKPPASPAPPASVQSSQPMSGEESTVNKTQIQGDERPISPVPAPPTQTPQTVQKQKSRPFTFPGKGFLGKLAKNKPLATPSSSAYEKSMTQSHPAVSPSPSEAFSSGKETVFKKPEGKGYWKTFAPADRVQNLDEYLDFSVGNFIEVLIAWKNRVLYSFHFSKKGSVYLGNEKDCEVPVSNLLNIKKYKLMNIDMGAKVFLDHGVKGALIQKTGDKQRAIHKLTGSQSIILKPYEIIRLDFRNLMRVYIRIKSKPSVAIPGGLFNLSFSETAVLVFSFLTTGLLLFYAGLYAPAFLQAEEEFLEKNIVQAQVKFEKPLPPKKPRVMEMKLSDRMKAKKKKTVVKIKKAKPQVKKPKPVVIHKSKKPKQVPKKTAGIKKNNKEKPGKIAAVAKGKKPPVKKKVAVGSARPGGSLKTGKSGSSAKTVAPDPTKTGLLGVFGGGGKLSKLDPGASGSVGGGLLGLAETSTGFAGTREGYEGEGVGTKTKELATGGQGNVLVGIKGIKTKGRGGNLFGKGKGRGGSLGSRGKVNINIGADDIEVEGEIDKAGIFRVIRRNRVKFDKCYQFSLQQQDSLEGTLKMEWQILPNGSVRKARAVQDNVGSSSLVNCMRRVLGQLRFPAPPRGQIPRVYFPFVFSI